MTAYLKTSNVVTVIFLVGMLWHFGTVFGLFGIAPTEQAEMFARLGIILGAVIITAWVSAFMVQTRQGSPMLPDEREEKIERVSESVGTVMIYAGLLLLAWFAFTPLSPADIVNGLLLIVTAVELVKLLIVLHLHRKENF